MLLLLQDCLGLDAAIGADGNGTARWALCYRQYSGALEFHADSGFAQAALKVGD
eukprot:SAG22_NODE_725_length_7622_cov_1.958926_11_plen_54_part_00